MVFPDVFGIARGGVAYMTVSTIFIKDLDAQAVIGVYPREQIQPQPIKVDVVFDVESDAATERDELDLTVDYEALTEAVLTFIRDSRYRLIETLAKETADHVLQHYTGIKRLQITLTKPQALPQTPHVGVIVERYA